MAVMVMGVITNPFTCMTEMRILTLRMTVGPNPEKDAIASIAIATINEGSGAVPCSKESY